MIIHLPHSSTRIPDATGFTSKELIEQEMALLTDWYTDQLFFAKKIKRIITPWSRLFCDVERFSIDDEEPMAASGRGVIYTKTHDMQQLRTLGKAYRERIIRKYYCKHHKVLHGAVIRELKEKGRVLIIDAHSFPSNVSLPEYEGISDFPDFCIGTDTFHTPPKVTMRIYRFLKDRGFSVSIDTPYSGTMVPKDFYKRNASVMSVMIEVNRKLYIQQDLSLYPGKTDQFPVIARMIQELLICLVQGQ